MNRVSPSNLYSNASAIRSQFNNWGVYGGDWYHAHAGAWSAAGWGAGAAWRTADWGAVGSWMDYYPSQPLYYDYGNNVAYQDDGVYMNGQQVATAQQYYDQASNLATAGAQAPASDAEWLPLGVFALTRPGKTDTAVTIQLAVSKQGAIRGNYTHSAADKTEVVQGSVDQQSQRVAFTVGENTANVIETGLYNLTQDEAPALIHFGKDRVEQWLLVRLKNPDTAQ